MNYFKTVITGLVLLAGVTAFAQDKTDQYKMKRTDGKEQIDAFPKAKEGYKQVYIQVPTDKNESDLKIEFFVGIEGMFDCNHQSLAGKIESKNLEGWGYSYYEVKYNGGMLTTNKGCGSQKATKKFVSFQPEIVRYNSKLPLVLYVPKDMEVRYRILRPDGDMKKAIQK